MVDNSVLQTEVSKLLSGADLNAFTSKKVRAELERVLGADLSHRKAEIEAAIKSALDAAAAVAATNRDNASDGGDSETDSSLSELDDDRKAVPKKAASKPPPAKRQRKKATTEDADDSTEKQKLSDEELARQLHLRENGLPRRRAAAAASASSSGSAGKKRKSGGGGGGGGGGFSKPCVLSPALASVVGCDSMPRQQVVKCLWDLAKERNLFDPKNKQFVICDAQFEKLFGKKRLRMFALMKYLKNHVKNVDT